MSLRYATVRSAFYFSLLVLLGVVPFARAQPPGKLDWPHVRGPAYDSTSRETGLIDSWPAAGPPVLWTRELGQGYSGFVVGGGRAYTQYQTRTGQFVIALDPETGIDVWRRRVGWAWQPAGAYPGPFATPTHHAGRVYYATPAGVVGCLDAGDGREIWSVDVNSKFAGRGTEFGYASTPLVEDGKVILPVGGVGASVVALDASDGSTVWAAGNDRASYCPAMPITLGGKRLVLAFLQNSLVAHDLKTGQVLWRQVLSREYDEHAAWPLYSEPELLASAPFRAGSHLFRLSHDEDRIVGRERWAGRALSLDVCSAVRVNDAVYGFDIQQLQSSTHRPSRGVFKCLDFATGAVRWETEAVGQATVLAADEKLILLDETGHLILAKADASEYRELGRAKVFDGKKLGWTPPALWGGRLFVRSHEKALCLFLGPPAALDPNRPRSEITRVDNGFDWGRLFAREPDFPNDAPSASEIAKWFAWCVFGVFGGAFLFAGLAELIARALRSPHVKMWFKGVFVLAALGLGMAGTTAIGAWADTFALTWPAALYTAFRLTLEVGSWARARSLLCRFAARGVLALFLFGCYGYYRLCLAVGYVVAWGFLAGLLAAFPAAVVAARSSDWRVRHVADAVGFTVYFWVSGLLPGWKSLSTG